MIKKQDILVRIKSLKLSHVLTMVIFSILFFGAVYGIVMYQTRNGSTKDPKVEVLYPTDGEIFDFETTVVEGSTSDAEKLYINNEEVIIDGNGRFVKEISLSEGDNLISVVAKSNKNEITQTINVKREKPIVFEEAYKPVVEKKPKQTVSNLSSSGPETLWIPEITALSLAGVSWYGSKKKLEKFKNQ